MTLPLFKANRSLQETFKLDPDVLFYMSGDYYYMSEAYYELIDAELAGQKLLPSSEATLDAYVVPLALEKASLAGIAVPESKLLMAKLPSNVLAYSVNPFSEKMRLISEKDDRENILKSLSRTGKYAVLCQTLPSDYRLDMLRCILGQTEFPEYKAFAAQIFKVFQLPLMKIRVIVSPEAYLFSAIEPLAFSDLHNSEKERLEGLGTWQE